MRWRHPGLEAKPGASILAYAEPLASATEESALAPTTDLSLETAAAQLERLVRLRQRNALIVGGKNALYQSELLAGDLNWISIESLTSSLDVTAKIRSGASPISARIEPHGLAKVKVLFDEPQMAPTPGQAVVFYDGEVVVGSGIITS